MLQNVGMPRRPTRARTPAAGPGPRGPARAALWLAAVCAAFTAVQLLLVVPGSGLGWDETVYTSQVGRDVPAAFFSAPRARGITFLAAPVVTFTTSVPALRVYLALLSGAGLFAALWVWRVLLPVRVLALAGGLFAGLWITVFYGPRVMPNLWSAYGALAAAGCLLRTVRDRSDRAAAAGLVVAVAVTGLMRPPDAAWLVLALAGAAVAVPAWRRPGIFVLLAAGLVAGCAEWVVEAYVSYGGLPARLRRAGEIQGGMGWNIAVDDQIRSLDGRALCRPCDVPWRHRAASAWWFALPVLAAGGALAAAPRGRRATAAVPLLAAASVAFPYLFTIGYAAPRFLLPAYALLALPVAECVWWLVTGVGGRLRPAATVLVVLGLCAHLGVQYGVAASVTASNRTSRTAYDTAAANLHRLGVRPPCVLSGDHAVPIAFHTGCASRQTSGSDVSITAAGLVALARTRPLAVVVPPGGRPPGYARDWPSAPLGAPGLFAGYRAYLGPLVPERR